MVEHWFEAPAVQVRVLLCPLKYGLGVIGNMLVSKTSVIGSSPVARAKHKRNEKEFTVHNDSE